MANKESVVTVMVNRLCTIRRELLKIRYNVELLKLERQEILEQIQKEATDG